MSQHNQHSKESLSAMLDGETDDLELRRLLRSWDDDPELARTWERYNLARSLLHNDGVPVSTALRLKIRQALADEPTHRPGRMTGWQLSLGRMAVAASVALVVMIGLRATLTTPELPAPGLLQQQPNQGQQPVAGGDTAIAGDNPAIIVDPIAQQRLFDYISRVTFDEEEPVRTEHIQDSPLYRLVNELQARP